MNTRPSADIPSDKSVSRSSVVGVLQRGQWECCTTGQPITTISPWTQAADAICPQIVVGGTRYTLVMQNEVPNVQPDGLVAFVGPQRHLATIPWGAHLRVRVDSFQTAGSFGCRNGRKIAGGVYLRARAVSIGS